TAGFEDEAHGVLGILQALADKPLTAAGTNVTPPEGAAFTGTVATFSDADAAAKASDFTATITWGDGHTSAGTVAAGANGGFTVSGTNTYAREGTYNISVTITDNNTTNDPGGSTATATGTATVSDAPLAVVPLTSMSAAQLPLAISNAPVAAFTDTGGA